MGEGLCWGSGSWGRSLRVGEAIRGLFLGLGFGDSLEADFLRAEVLARGPGSTKPSSSNSWAATLLIGLGSELLPTLGLKFAMVCSTVTFVAVEGGRGGGGGRDDGSGDGAPSPFLRSLIFSSSCFRSRDSLST